MNHSLSPSNSAPRSDREPSRLSRRRPSSFPPAITFSKDRPVPRCSLPRTALLPPSPRPACASPAHRTGRAANPPELQDAPASGHGGGATRQSECALRDGCRTHGAFHRPNVVLRAAPRQRQSPVHGRAGALEQEVLWPISPCRNACELHAKSKQLYQVRTTLEPKTLSKTSVNLKIQSQGEGYHRNEADQDEDEA